MSLVYLVGDPVDHSLSPAMQNAAFAAAGLPHRYETLRLEPRDLRATFDRFRADDVLGANVTIPYKERVARFLDTTNEEVRRLGAVNTVVKRGRVLHGENTDGVGFAAALAERGVSCAGKRAVVLGAGGAARACVLELMRAGARVEVANRTPERAAKLVEQLSPGASDPPRAVGWPESAAVAEYDLVVNATSLGMHGEDALADAAWRPEMGVVDIVATREETPLVRRAREAGCVTVDGLLMLLHQGAAAYRLWTGQDAPIEAMRAALPRAG